MKSDHRTSSLRRHFLRQAGRFSVAAMLPASILHAWGAQQETRALILSHTHTGERINLAYADGGRYVPEALRAMNHFLRDHYTSAVGTIDPQVFDLMYRIQQLVGGAGAFEIISGYRGADTNARLRDTRGGGVARNSLHLEGRAVDGRLPGVALNNLCDAALSLRVGGVGYYPREKFVHLDTGLAEATSTIARCGQYAAR